MGNHLLRGAFSALVVCVLSATSLCSASELRFTAIPDQDTTRLIQRFEAVSDYLEQQLGIEVSYVPVKTYAASVEAFKNNDVQLAWFGGLSGVQARLAVPGSLAIAQGAEDTQFQSYLIAHSSTGLSPQESFPQEIAGKSFTFGSRGSTSGRLMPEYFIRQFSQQGPEKIFSRVGFSGNHSKTIELVQAGSYEVGAVNYKVWKTELENGDIDLNQVSVIWETPYYVDYNWSIRGDVDSELRQRVTDALLAMDDPDLLASFPRSGFIPAANDDYATIEQTARELGIIRE